MSTIEGNYFDGNYPIAVKAKVTFMDREASLAAGSSFKYYQKDHLKVSSRICSSRRFITFPDGGQFECDDSSYLNSLPQESKFEGIVAWLEERWIIALACVALISLLFAVGYFFGLPAAAEHIAPRIPMETQRTIGIQTLTYLDDLEWLKQKGLSPEAFATLMERLANKNGNKVGPPSWVSTHPVTSERINRARDAAAE